MAQIYGVGAPSKIKKSGVVYQDTRTGIIYKQNKVPFGNEWTVVDSNVSDDSNSSTSLTHVKVYSQQYTADSGALFSTPASLGTLTTENGNPGIFVFLSCQSNFDLTFGDYPYDTTPNEFVISDFGGDNIFKVPGNTVVAPFSFPNLTLSKWDKADVHDQINHPPSTVGLPGPKSSIELILSSDVDAVPNGQFGFCTFTIYITYTIIQ